MVWMLKESNLLTGSLYLVRQIDCHYGYSFTRPSGAAVSWPDVISEQAGDAAPHTQNCAVLLTFKSGIEATLYLLVFRTKYTE
jgi:hypothetical protein